MKDLWFSGRHALVTGGSSGIGLAIARRFAALGTHVHLVARSAGALELAARDLTRTGAEVTPHACDVGDREAVQRLFAALANAGHRPTIVVNSAGVSRPGYVEEIPIDDFERLVRVNYLGTVYVVKLALPHLLETGDGYIVNVSSVAGLMGVFGFTAYSGSKYAVTGFTEALRSELHPRGVGVSLLCPPDTDTPMLAREAANKPKETEALSGSAGVLDPEQVVDALLVGMRRRTAVIVPGASASAVVLAHRLVPRVVEGYVNRVVRRARRSVVRA